MIFPGIEQGAVAPNTYVMSINSSIFVSGQIDRLVFLGIQLFNLRNVCVTIIFIPCMQVSLL